MRWGIHLGRSERILPACLNRDLLPMVECSWIGNLWVEQGILVRIWWRLVGWLSSVEELDLFQYGTQHFWFGWCGTRDSHVKYDTRYWPVLWLWLVWISNVLGWFSHHHRRQVILCRLLGPRIDVDIALTAVIFNENGEVVHRVYLWSSHQWGLGKSSACNAFNKLLSWH